MVGPRTGISTHEIMMPCPTEATMLPATAVSFVSLQERKLRMTTQAEAETYVRQRAQVDLDFRHRLIRDPRSLILAETGYDLSDEQIVLVREEIGRRLAAAETCGPLTDEELEQVSGGGHDWSYYL